MADADDIVILGTTKKKLKSVVINVEKAAIPERLITNEKKTKYIELTTKRRAGEKSSFLLTTEEGKKYELEKSHLGITTIEACKERLQKKEE